MIIIDGSNYTKSMYLFSSYIIDPNFDLHKVKDGCYLRKGRIRRCCPLYVWPMG
jgi:hypothetical protein